MVTKVEELNHVGARLWAANLTLLLQDGGPGDGEVDKSSEFGSLEISSEESINLLPHVLLYHQAYVMSDEDWKVAEAVQ